jgi:hypothetical protein
MTPNIRQWLRPCGPAALLALLCLASAAATTPAVAEGAGVAGTPYIDCKCRANGRTFGLGERACVYTPDGPRIARCSMVQNVTSWAVEDGQGCVSSALRLGGGSRG